MLPRPLLSVHVTSNNRITSAYSDVAWVSVDTQTDTQALNVIPHASLDNTEVRQNELLPVNSN